MCEKNKITKKTGPHTSTSLEEKFLASCHKEHDGSKEQVGRRRRSNTRGFLRKCQPPACQRVPVATTDRSGRTQCQDKKTRNIKQTTAWANRSTRRKKKKIVQTTATCGDKGNGALGVKSPLFHRTCDKTT